MEGEGLGRKLKRSRKNVGISEYARNYRESNMEDGVGRGTVLVMTLG